MSSSILPQQILPPSTPWGTVVNGKVIVDKNWWLFLYNLYLVSGVGQISNADLQALLETLQEPDRPNDPQGLLPPDIGYVEIPDQLPPDPPPAQSQAQPESAVTPGASPYTYQALYPGWVVVSGGTVSAIALGRTAFYGTGLTAGVFPLARLDQIKVTYTGTPTMTFFPQ